MARRFRKSSYNHYYTMRDAAGNTQAVCTSYPCSMFAMFRTDDLEASNTSKIMFQYNTSTIYMGLSIPVTATDMKVSLEHYDGTTSETLTTGGTTFYSNNWYLAVGIWVADDDRRVHCGLMASGTALDSATTSTSINFPNVNKGYVGRRASVYLYADLGYVGILPHEITLDEIQALRYGVAPQRVFKGDVLWPASYEAAIWSFLCSPDDNEANLLYKDYRLVKGSASAPDIVPGPPVGPSSLGRPLTGPTRRRHSINGREILVA